MLLVYYIAKTSIFDSNLLNNQTVYLSQDGFTALHLAAQEGYLDVCMALCQQGASMSAVTNVSVIMIGTAAVSNYTILLMFIMLY